MYSTNNSKPNNPSYGDLVSVTVVNRNNSSYQVVFNVSGKKKTISGFKSNQLEATRIAKALAHDLDTGLIKLEALSDLTSKELRLFCDKRYCDHQDTVALTLIESIKTESKTIRQLSKIWVNYKKAKANTTPNSTKTCLWRSIDKWLEQLPTELDDLDKSLEILEFLRNTANNGKGYSDKSLAPSMRILKAAVQLGLDTNLIDGNNPLIKVYDLLDKSKTKPIQSFTENDISIIVNAFETNRFNSDHSAYDHSYYANLIKFRFLTGCRPSEVFGLTWNDIKMSDNGNYQVVFNKRYSYGEILDDTKNGTSRIFYCNNQLTEFLKSLEVIPNDLNLVFPSIAAKSYINSRNFSRDIWLPIVGKLFSLGLISVYLPFYDQRHTFGTLAVRHTSDLVSVSAIMGNSPKTLMSNYLAVNKDVNYLPDITF